MHIKFKKTKVGYKLDMFEIQKETPTKDDWVSLVVKLLKVYKINLQHFTTGSYASWHHLGYFVNNFYIYRKSLFTLPSLT